MSLIQVAKQSHITQNTAKVQLKSIFSKIGGNKTVPDTLLSHVLKRPQNLSTETSSIYQPVLSSAT
ncbi:MAG TPA: hypothetical protein ENJ87_05925 [Gammaproteobacteria bacterium]|nr:hypothetical protein [Gammaproteobacteria bacterium]